MAKNNLVELKGVYNAALIDNKLARPYRTLGFFGGWQRQGHYDRR